jgi:hypothetical protein
MGKRKALRIALDYGQIDGAHHKQWVIDQMVRELCGDHYQATIAAYENDGEYWWDTGTPP